MNGSVKLQSQSGTPLELGDTTGKGIVVQNGGVKFASGTRRNSVS